MNESSPDLRTFCYDQITVGMKESRDYVITPEIYQHFLEAFQDRSPVHVDEEFAKAQGFAGRVMHGSILNGFVSHFIGMYFPGKFSFLLSVDLRYSNPSYLGDAIRLDATVSQKMDTHNIIILDATLANTTRNYLAARGRIQVMIKENK